ncbi:MAG: hypothetical protein AAFR21_14830 [Pseudomonadota bacterium]
MTVQLRRKTEDDPPRGVARRYDNFEDVAGRGGDYQGLPVTRLALMRAMAQGTPDLSDGARSLLAFYLCCLDTRRLGEGKTSVWPGNAAAGEALGKSDPTIRRLKGELERAGFLLRKYDRRNRPLDGDAIDLAPFLAEVPSILRQIEERAAARAAEREAARAADASTTQAETSGEARKIERLNSTSKNLDSCFENRIFEETKTDKPKQNDGAVSEAKQAIQDGVTIRQALDLSPKLKAALDPEGEGLSAQLAAQKIWEVLPDLFPNDGANSISHTFLWCAKRHGAKAFLFLAIALEDPTTRDPRKLFGWFATNPEKIDVTRNLERIRNKPKPLEPEKQASLKLPGDPFENEIAVAIAERLGVATYNAWFAPKSTRYRSTGDGKLIIEHESSIARERMANHFRAQLRVAAESLGYEGGVRIEAAR